MLPPSPDDDDRFRVKESLQRMRPFVSTQASLELYFLAYIKICSKVSFFFKKIMWTNSGPFLFLFILVKHKFYRKKL